MANKQSSNVLTSIKNVTLDIAKWLGSITLALASVASILMASSWFLMAFLPGLAGILSFGIFTALLVSLNASVVFMGATMITGLLAGGFATLEALVNCCVGSENDSDDEIVDIPSNVYQSDELKPSVKQNHEPEMVRHYDGLYQKLPVVDGAQATSEPRTSVNGQRSL